MRLARLVYRNNNPWRYGDGTKINLSIGTIVQYKQSVDGGYEVYFPGVQGYAPMGGYGFSIYFEDLDNEAS